MIRKLTHPRLQLPPPGTLLPSAPASSKKITHDFEVYQNCVKRFTANYNQNRFFRSEIALSASKKNVSSSRSFLAATLAVSSAAMTTSSRSALLAVRSAVALRASFPINAQMLFLNHASSNADKPEPVSGSLRLSQPTGTERTFDPKLQAYEFYMKNIPE